MPSHAYRIRVGKAGVDTLGSSTNVAFSFSTTGSTGLITGLTSWGGQEVRPLEGKTLTIPWSFTLGESTGGTEVSKHISDAQGRAQLQRRLIDISASTSSGSTWDVQATGRIEGISLTRDIGAYQFTVHDERYVERNTKIFTAADTTDPTDTSGVDIAHGAETSSVYPAGLTRRWMGVPAVTRLQFRVKEVSGNRVTLQNNGRAIGKNHIGPYLTMSRQVRDAIQDDVSPAARPAVAETTATVGEFEHLVANIDVVGSTTGTTIRPLFAKGIINEDEVGVDITEEYDFLEEGRAINEINVVWPGSTLAVNDLANIFLYMPTREPDGAIRTHVGSSSWPGTHPFQIAKDIYDAIGIRTDSTQFSALIADKKYRGAAYIIDGPANAAAWMDEHIYQWTGTAPFINAAGEVSPRRIFQPTADEVASSTGLFTFGSSNIAGEHPTWEQGGSDLVTRINYHHDSFQNQSVRAARQDSARQEAGDLPADMLRVLQDVNSVRHDRAESGELPDVEIDIRLPVANVRGAAPQRLTQFTRHDIFDRFGDGAIRSEVAGFKAAETNEPGQYVTVDLDTFTNIGSTSGRGTKRVMQVMRRTFSDHGPRFELLDAGSSDARLTSPTVTASQSTTRPRHEIDLSVTSTGEHYLVRYAESTSVPASTSDEWLAGGSNPSTDSSFILSDLPSGKTWQVQARATAPNRIGSTWSAAASADTQALPAPDALLISDITQYGADYSWTPGTTDALTEVRLDSTRQAVLGAGAETYEQRGLDAGTTYTASVRHIDRFGGVSASTSQSFTTASSGDAPSSGGIAFPGDLH